MSLHHLEQVRKKKNHNFQNYHTNFCHHIPALVYFLDQHSNYHVVAPLSSAVPVILIYYLQNFKIALHETLKGDLQYQSWHILLRAIVIIERHPIRG